MQLLDHVSITVRSLSNVKPFYLAVIVGSGCPCCIQSRRRNRIWREEPA